MHFHQEVLSYAESPRRETSPTRENMNNLGHHLHHTLRLALHRGSSFHHPAFKGVAWQLTGLVGSCRMPSSPSSTSPAPLMALWMLTLVAQPADAAHCMGTARPSIFQCLRGP